VTPYCGTAADTVDEIKMALYNGTTITASATENEDIFWASKGGTSGIGGITHFWSRVVQNPSETKKFTAYTVAYIPSTDADDAEQLETQVDILMRYQGLYYDDPKGVLLGETGPSVTSIGDVIFCYSDGIFCK